MQKNRKLLAVLLVGAIFLIILARAPDVLLLPSLQVEDGSHVFAHFYHNRGAIHLLRAKAGYVPLLANLMGYVSVRLPTVMIPYGLSWLPLLSTLASYSLFFSRRYRVVVPRDGSRAVVCLLFALAPLSEFLLLAHTDYSIWNSLLLLILLGTIPLPTGRAAAVAWWSSTNLLVWSHPLSIVLLPIQIYLGAKNRPWARWHWVTAVNLVLYQVLGTEGARIVAHRGFFTILLLLWETSKATLTMLSDIAFRTAFGQLQFAWAKQNMDVLIHGVDVVVLLLVGLAMKKEARFRKPVAVILYLMASITFLSLLSRGVVLAELKTYMGGSRYCYLQSLGFIVLLVGSLSVLPRPVFGSPISPALLLRVNRLFFPLLLLHYYRLNTEYGHHLFFNVGQKSPYCASDPRNGRIVQDFFARLATQEARPRAKEGAQPLVAAKIRDWPIKITVGGGADGRSCPSTKRLCGLMKLFG